MSDKDDPGSTAPQEASIRYDIIKWKLFDFLCFHMRPNSGSAHIHLGHSNDFDYFSDEEKEILKEIRRIEKSTPLIDRKKIVQSLMEKNKGLFEKVEQKCVQHLQSIIDNSKQTFITFEEHKLNIILQYQKDRGIHYLMAVADGLNQDGSFESVKPLKLITGHTLKPPKLDNGLVENAPPKMKTFSEKVWIKYDTCSFAFYPTETREGIFLELNETAIDQRSGIFLKLFRHGNPTSKNDEELKSYLKHHYKIVANHLQKSRDQEANRSKTARPCKKKNRKNKHSEKASTHFSIQSALSPSQLGSTGNSVTQDFYLRAGTAMQQDLVSIKSGPDLKRSHSAMEKLTSEQVLNSKRKRFGRISL